MEQATRGPTDRPPWAWRLVVGVVLWFLRRVRGWRVRAEEPAFPPRPEKPLVVVFNHTSNVDAFLVVDTVWRRLRHWCQPLVKAELFDVPVLGTLARDAGAIPVSRQEGAGREAAYDDAVARLRADSTIMIAPEGTITHDGSLLPLRHGAARLALEAGVDVLVVTHFGAQRGFSPVARFAEREVVVTMSMDVLTAWPDEDARSLTGRVAATMIDRSEQLQADYPQAAVEARWWPPYSAPASPTATARENLERYREAMADAIDQARQRMAAFAEGHEVEQRVTQARERAATAAEELAARSRARAEILAEQARHRFDELNAQAREHAATLGWASSMDDDRSDVAPGTRWSTDSPSEPANGATMASNDVDLTPEEEQIFRAVSRLEEGDDTATIRRVAQETGLDVHRTEEILGRLATTHDLVQERRTELDPDATGTGRQYVVKAAPSPTPGS